MRNTFTRFSICLLAGILYCCACFGQQNPQNIHEHEQCGTQQWLEAQLNAYPQLRQQYRQMEQKMGNAVTKKLAKAKTTAAGPAQLRSLMMDAGEFYIPVVFHIVGTAPTSITDAQIVALLDTLNKDFGGTNSDSVKILPGFKPLFGKSNIRFCFAQRTPGGAVTNGIMRYTSSVISNNSSTSDPIKSTAAGGADAWDPTRYMNVWIGTFSLSGLLGYASFPITSPENPTEPLSQQGLVIEKGTVPGGATANYNTGRVLTHEIGHFFWLRHIWGDDACGDDFPNTPGIDDTPTQSGASSGCGVGIVATGCTGTAPNGRMYQNYMDYSASTCMALFSTGQTIRMALCLDSFRTSLKTSNGCQPVNCPAFNINVAITGTSGSVSITGGQPPYYYSLDSINFQTSNVFTGLVPGNSYTVYVRDTFFCKGKTSFIASSINVSPLPGSLCTNQSLTIAFTTTGAFTTGNIFTAQLSNASGSFANPVNIGTITGTGNGTINATIPNTMPPGNRYRIRVSASNPAVAGISNSTDLEITNADVTPAVSIAITAGVNPGCSGNTYTFRATAVNGGNAPVFTWKRNGTNVDTGRTYTTNSLLNNDVITCSLLSNSTCTVTYAAVSNSITMVLNNIVMPSVTISTDVTTDTICSGTSVTFRATPVNGGASPRYQWRKNGVNVSDTLAVYSTTTLANTDTITCAVTSSLTCTSPATAVSNKIRFAVTPSVTPSVIITSSAGASTCPGTPVMFTATPTNGGVSPSYQWRKNSTNVGTNSNVYTYNSIANGDTIRCILTRTTPAVCLSSTTATSNAIRMTLQNCGMQLVSGNAFLKDNYVEVAVGSCGNFASTVAPPTGYHPRGDASGRLGFIADTGKTGWVSYVGDYFLPGTPEEGFGVTVNGVSNNNNQICSQNNIPGSITNIQASSLEKSATWQGTINGLTITAKTFIPAGALYFVTKVTLTNTSAAPLNNIFYMRNVDPDQGTSTPGSSASTSTYNSIVYQTPNTCNRSLVTATARPNAEYLGLGSADPRARVSKGGFSNRIASNIWNGIGVTQSGTNAYADSAISIAFNIGTLNVNENTTFSYAYILSTADLEKALAATAVDVHISGVKADVGKVTDICAGSAIPLNLGNTGSYTSWSWTPAAGLNTTTGTSVLATVTAPITYKATGTGPCGTISLDIALNPVTQPAVGTTGAITGPASPIQGAATVIYSIPAVANATGYVWNVPAGVLFNSNSDSSVISVRMPAGTFCDSISVMPRNACSSGSRSVINICLTSPYSITPGIVSEVCTVAPVARLPFTAVTGSPTSYSIVWDAAALAAGFVHVTNAVLPASPITIIKPTTTPAGNYTGRISVGNGPLNSALYSFTVPVISVPIVVPSISVTASTSTSICAGAPVTFTATATNGGTAPVYQWRKNGLNVGTGAATYSDNNIVNGDTVHCKLNSTATCVSPDTAISNGFRFAIISTAIASLTISSPTGSNSCTGSTVTFTATAVNVGTSPVYQWKKNGVNVATGITYSSNSLITNDSISCLLTSNNACSTAVTVNSNTIVMNVATVTAPTASGAATIDCGQTVTLTGTPTTTGNIINWYTAASGGAPFAKGNTVAVTPATTTTYYAEGGSANGGTSKMVTSIATTGAVIIDHNNITGDDRAGIAISTNYVYVTGDSYTGRYSKNLSGGTSLSLRDGFFSNLANGDLWQLGNNTSGGAPLTSGAITRLYQLNESLVPTGSFLTLSQTITISYLDIVASGEGFVILYANNLFYRINLNNGEVTNMTGVSGFSYNSAEGGATYAWSEFDGTNYYLCYVENSTLISKRNIATGVKTTIQTFSSLGETAAVVFDPQENRMYFHYEGSSQFGGSGEVLGYVAVSSTHTVPLCGSTRVPVTVTVNASTLTPSINIISNFSGSICSGATVTFTASATNGGAMPAYRWRRNGINVATGVTYTLTSPANNDTISCVFTSSTFCVTTPTATSNSIVLSVITPSPTPFVNISSSASGNVCAGTNITFTATVSNAGTTPVYQWKKNGLNVGTNSTAYMDNATVSGSISCVVTTNTPCSTILTSGSIFISPIAALQPSITIASNTINPICTGTPVTFTATPVNGGSTPTYQWKKNGINVSTSGAIYTISALLNGDTITCVLTSNYACVTQNNIISNAIGISVTPIPAANTISNRTVCSGSTLSSVSFSGSGTQYRWTNSNTAIGLAANGFGNIPSFMAANTGATPITATVTVTPYSTGAAYAYVANSTTNTVSVINLQGNTVAATIPVGSAPWGVATSPDGSRVYVANSGTPSSISVINTVTNQVITNIPVSASVANVCVSLDGTKLYASSYSSGIVYMFNTQTNTLQSSYSVGSGLYGMAISPDGLRLYVTATNYLYVFNSATFSLIASVAVGTSPISVAASADGSRVYVSNANNNTVSVINTTTNTLVANVVTGSSPYNLALSSDGKTLYVANNTSNNVSVINTITNQVTATIAAGSSPSGISINGDGTLIYVTNQGSNTVSVINTVTNTVTATLSGFSGPLSWGNFISSRQGCAGTPVSFTINVAAPNTNTWIGAVSTDWHTPENWLCNRIPTANDKVVIAISANNYYPLLLENDSITIKSIRLEPGTKVHVSTNASLILTSNQ